MASQIFMKAKTILYTVFVLALIFASALLWLGIGGRVTGPGLIELGYSPDYVLYCNLLLILVILFIFWLRKRIDGIN